MEIVINKKKYHVKNNTFVFKHHTEYFNLKIYPAVNELEREAGLLSDFAEAFLEEGLISTSQIYGDQESESIKFIQDNLKNFNENGTMIVSYLDPSYKENVNADVLLAQENIKFNQNFFKKINIQTLNKVLYLSKYAFDIFNKYFWYYMKDGNFCYDNLICYTMIIKNGGPLLEKVLTENLPFIDRWCILDTGSTDGTQETIRRVLKNKKGKLYEEPFVDFKVSRNRCLDLAKKVCKFSLMLDDTYSMRGDIRKFLDIVRGDQFSDTFSLMIQSDDTEYYSNRIVKMDTSLRYIHTIHEVITDKNNVNVTVPPDQAFIFDHRAQYMEDRTNNRKQFDLQLLFKEFEEDPNDPRALYYIAQTYGCIGDEINKAKYFELRVNHPVQGYVQEKIDACFELARTYNFKVNCETKELISSDYKLSDSMWKRCEELYMQAYELDQKRPDSLYFIGIHYYLKKEFSKSYPYFKKGLEIGYPLGSQYSLKPTLSFHFLPRFLAEVSYYMGDYQTGLKACELFLTSSTYNKQGGEFWDLMTNWYKIYSKIINMGEISKTPTNHSKTIVLVTDGGWEPWTGKDILTKGLGGSETWIIETARYLKRITDCNVCVFCNTDKSEFFEDVGYNPITQFPHFIANNKVEIVIVSRYIEYAHVALKGHAEKVGIIFHDTLGPDPILPVDNKLKWIFGLTDWHSDLIKTIFSTCKEKVYTLNYGIDQKRFHESVKIKNSFIYSSFPNRGLLVLLKMWPRIVEEFKDATLNIYCNLEQEWVNQVAPEIMREIKSLLKVNKKGIKVHGWVDRKTLANAWKTAEYWLYPCTFEETFCLTAMEAALTKTFAITNNLAALAETVGDRGLIVHGDPRMQEWQDSTLAQMRQYLSGKSKEDLLQLNYNWAKERSWRSQTQKFVTLMGVFQNNFITELPDNYGNMLNWTDDVPKGTRQSFDYALSLLKPKSKILEIGVFAGTSIAEILKQVPESTATVIDSWTDYYEHDNLLGADTPALKASESEKLFYKNTSLFSNRIKVLKGRSSDKLLELLKLNETFHFIYVDASHKCMDVFMDAMISWKLLKIGGIMVFDDYRFNKGDILNSPYEAIEQFKRNYSEDFVIIAEDYRVYVKKIN